MNQKGIFSVVIIAIIIAVIFAAGIFALGKFDKISAYVNYKLGRAYCIQVVAPLRNIKTNECKIYPTPCDVPPWLGPDWTEDQTCLSNNEAPDNEAPDLSQPKSGIRGKAILVDCPGVNLTNLPPGSQKCGKAPLDFFELKIKKYPSGEERQITTDENGKFTIGLEPGMYIISIAPGQESRFYGNSSFDVEVKAGEFTDIQPEFILPRP